MSRPESRPPASPQPDLDSNTGRIPGVPGRFLDHGSTPGGLDVIVQDPRHIIAVPAPENPVPTPVAEPGPPKPKPAPPIPDAISEPPVVEPIDEYEGKRFKDVPLVKYYVPDENGDPGNIHLVVEVGVPGDEIDWAIPSDRQLTEGNGRQILLYSVGAKDKELVHYVEGGLVYNLTDPDQAPMPLDLGLLPPVTIDGDAYKLTSPDGKRTLDLGTVEWVEISHKTSPKYEGSESIESKNSAKSPHEPPDPFIIARHLRDSIASGEAPSMIFTHPKESVPGPTSIRERLGAEVPSFSTRAGISITTDGYDNHNRTAVLKMNEQNLWGLFEGRNASQAKAIAIGEQARDHFMRNYDPGSGSLEDTVQNMKAAFESAHREAKITKDSSDSMAVRVEQFDGKSYAVWVTNGRDIFVQKTDESIIALNQPQDTRTGRIGRDKFAGDWTVNRPKVIEAGAYELQEGDRILLSAQNPNGYGHRLYLRKLDLKDAAEELTRSSMYRLDAGIVVEITKSTETIDPREIDSIFRAVDAPPEASDKRKMFERLEEDVLPKIVRAKKQRKTLLYNALLGRLDQTIDGRWGGETAEKVKARMLNAMARLENEATKEKKLSASNTGSRPLGWVARRAAGIRRKP